MTTTRATPEDRELLRQLYRFRHSDASRFLEAVRHGLTEDDRRLLRQCVDGISPEVKAEVERMEKEPADTSKYPLGETGSSEFPTEYRVDQTDKSARVRRKRGEK